MTLYYFFISRIPFSLILFKDLISSLSFNTNRNDMSLKRKAEETLYDVANATSLLDLPDLALDCILERLSPESLRAMSLVCFSMRERCLSDRLWERHMSQKWGQVIGHSAHREWQWHIATTTSTDLNRLDKSQAKQKGFMRLLSLGWPFSWMRPRVDGNSFDAIDDDCSNSPKAIRSRLTVMARYLALEAGKFCFRAQVYNRENGHVGFMLSCYDAQMSYDPKTDTFEARYPPHGRRAMAVESGVPWERVRAPPVDTPPHDLHTSDCLHILKPGHHIEIQWRRKKDFPYGWWYGVVGHLESCDGNEKYCRCHENDTVVLEFNQYTPGSGWRHTTVNRKDHREEGNEVDGFYGGIRKLSNDHEISMWKQLWPAETLD